MGFHWNDLHIRPRLLVLLFTALLAAALVYFLQFSGNMDQRILYGILVVAVLSTAGALYEFIYEIEDSNLTALLSSITAKGSQVAGAADDEQGGQDGTSDR